jgi:transposase InsO family protein
MGFKMFWLTRYPRPIQVIHHQSPEFKAPPFQAALICNGIESVPITINNQQANAVSERFHSTIQNQLGTIFPSNPPQDIGDALDVIDSTIASTVFTS